MEIVESEFQHWPELVSSCIFISGLVDAATTLARFYDAPFTKTLKLETVGAQSHIPPRCFLIHNPSHYTEAFVRVLARAERETHRLEESALDLEEILSLLL